MKKEIKEKAVIFSVTSPRDDLYFKQHSLYEIRELTRTAGAEIVFEKIIRIRRFTPKYLISKGQLEAIKKSLNKFDYELIIFDIELKPVQIKNLEEFFKKKILGRTEIILDIFAKRATTKEAKLQVELAQLTYLLPRLKGLGKALSNTGGGIGTRGPGEKMLETDRRHLIRRIRTLKRKIEKIKTHRGLIQASHSGQFVVAITGYTNSGKTTLLNRLAKLNTFTEDKLFATLDTKTAQVWIDHNMFFLAIDTVGFIQKISHNLIAAFHSSLEEIKYADLTLHVIDISDPFFKEKTKRVFETLKEIGAEKNILINIFNKIDSVPNPGISFIRELPNSCLISARKGTGIDILLSMIKKEMIKKRKSFYKKTY